MKDTINVLHYTVDGEVHHKTIQKDNLLQELQDLVGGYIQMVAKGSQALIVNEEGLLIGLPVNQSSHLFGFGELRGDLVLMNSKHLN